MKNNEIKDSSKNRVSLSLSHQAALGWGTGVLVLLALFFFLGTLVGRNMIRVDLGQDGLFLEIAGSREAEKRLSLSEMDRMPGDAPEFLFFKELNKDADDKNAAGKKQVAAVAPADKNRSVVKRQKDIVKPNMLATTPTPKKAAAVTEPPRPPTPKPVKAAAVPAALTRDIYKYTIQAGSFRTAEDADKMVARLNGMGYQAYSVKGLVRDNEIWFRVRIGAFKDRMDADSSLGRLKQDNIDAFLVTR